MSRLVRRLAPLSFAVLIAALLAMPAASGAASTATCKLSASKARGLGPTYVTYAAGRPGLKMRGTTCANGTKVVKAFHGCRKRNGGADGLCKTKVLGYSCRDRRPAAEDIPTQFTGYVTCRRGSAVVSHTYQQDR